MKMLYIREWRRKLMLFVLFCVAIGLLVVALSLVTRHLSPSYWYGSPRSDAIKASQALHAEQLPAHDRLLYFYWIGE
jgi:hypothetical protein